MCERPPCNLVWWSKIKTKTIQRSIFFCSLVRRDNKNVGLLTYCRMLVETGVFKEISVHFLPVGHTHCDVGGYTLFANLFILYVLNVIILRSFACSISPPMCLKEVVIPFLFWTPWLIWDIQHFYCEILLIVIGCTCCDVHYFFLPQTNYFRTSRTTWPGRMYWLYSSFGRRFYAPALPSRRFIILKALSTGEIPLRRSCVQLRESLLGGERLAVSICLQQHGYLLTTSVLVRGTSPALPDLELKLCMSTFILC